jgi:hypothetical protein
MVGPTIHMRGKSIYLFVFWEYLIIKSTHFQSTSFNSSTFSKSYNLFLKEQKQIISNEYLVLSHNV